jgi:hypothetical protein
MLVSKHGLSGRTHPTAVSALGRKRSTTAKKIVEERTIDRRRQRPGFRLSGPGETGAESLNAKNLAFLSQCVRHHRCTVMVVLSAGTSIKGREGLRSLRNPVSVSAISKFTCM